MIRTFGCTLRYISAAAVVHGPTVLEPSALMLPFSFGAFCGGGHRGPAASASAMREDRGPDAFAHAWLPFRWLSEVIVDSAVDRAWARLGERRVTVTVAAPSFVALAKS